MVISPYGLETNKVYGNGHVLLTIVKCFGGPHVGSLGDGEYSYNDSHYALYFSLSQSINLYMWIDLIVYILFLLQI